MMEPFKYSYKTEKDDAALVNVYNSGYQKCTPGYHMGPLTRNRYLIHHVVSGKGYYVVNGETFSIQEGDSFLIYPNTVVSYFADREDPWEYYWVGFDGPDAKILIGKTDFLPTYPVMTTHHSQELKELLLAIYHSSGGEFYKHIAMVGSLYLFLSKLIQYSKKQDDSVNRSLEYTKKAVDFISEQYANPLSVHDIADHLGVSRSHLYRVFMQNMSESPQVYLEKFRMKQSRILLEQTSLTIGEVANSVGYEDPLHFSKAFKRLVGISPKGYQRDHKKAKNERRD